MGFVRGHPILQTIQGRMNACQHRVPVSIERKGKQDQPRETLRNRVVQKSKRGLGHIITEERCQKSRFMHLPRIELISIYSILGLQRQEAIAMGTLRFADLQTRPTEVLDLTSLTVDELRQLVPPFEAAFQAYMADWRLDAKPRRARRYTTYTNCPLPTPEDRLLFILVYLKTYPLQGVQGRLFGMGQSKGH